MWNGDEKSDWAVLLRFVAAPTGAYRRLDLMLRTGVVPLYILLFYDQSYVDENEKVRVIVPVVTHQ